MKWLKNLTAVPLKLWVGYAFLILLSGLALYLAVDTFRQGPFSGERTAIKSRISTPGDTSALTQIIKRIKHLPEKEKLPQKKETPRVPPPKNLSREPGPLASLLQQALSLYNDGKKERSQKIFLYIVESDPVSLEAREASLHLAKIYRERGDLLEALKWIQRAYKLDSEDPLVNYHYGLILYQLEKYKDSIPYFKKALKYDPNNMIYHKALAKAYYHTENFDQAFYHFTQAVKLAKSKDPELLFYRALSAEKSPSRISIALEAYRTIVRNFPTSDYAEKSYRKLAEYYFSKKDWKKARKYFLKALSFNPQDEGILFNLGLIALKKRDFSQGVKYFKKVIELNPNRIEAYQNLARLYLELGRPREALSYLNRLIEKKPYNQEALLLKAYLYDELGEIDKAIREYKRTISIEPFSEAAKKAHMNLGVLYEKKGDILTAIDHYRQADPKDPLTHYNLAVAYEKQGISEKAIEEYRQALTLDPNNPHFHYALGRLYYDLQMYSEALKEIDKAIEQGDDRLETHLLKAGLLGKLNRNEEALALYDDLLLRTDLSQKDIVKILNNKAVLYLRENQPDRALKVLEVALEKDPRNAIVYHNLGLAYAAKEDYTKAVRALLRSLKFDPRNKEAHLDLAEIYFKLGLYEDARIEYENVLKLDRSNLEAQVGLRKVREATL